MSSAPVISAAKVVNREPLQTQDARWVRLLKTTYKDPNGTERTWESGERLTRPANADIDGVGIIAILEKPNSPPSILLQKQYRPPIDKITIEVPAGLIDPNETPEVCAVRELLEETGYHGTVVEDNSSSNGGTSGNANVSCIMFNDPGFCNTNLRFVHVKVDMEDERNKNPKQQLEENEFIECFTVPVDRLWEECRRLEQEGCAIDARVGTLAEGFRIAKMWKLFQ